MINAIVMLYIASETRLVRLQKMVGFVAMPRVGEWIKLRNAQVGDYIPYLVSEVTHREGAGAELVLGIARTTNGAYDLLAEGDLDEHVESYVGEGWELKSKVENRVYRN